MKQCFVRQQGRMKEDDKKDGVSEDAKDSDDHIDATVDHFIDYIIIAKIPRWMIVHQHVDYHQSGFLGTVLSVIIFLFYTNVVGRHVIYVYKTNHALFVITYAA